MILKKGKKQENPSFFWPFPSAFPELLREGTELNFPVFFRPFPGIRNDRGREQSPGAFVERELRVTENHSGNVGTKTWPGKAPEAKIPGKKNGILAALVCSGEKNIPVFGNAGFFWDWGNTGIS